MQISKLINQPFFPYPAWVPSYKNRFLKRAKEQLYEEAICLKGGAEIKCMVPSCRIGENHDDINCHHIIPQEFGGPGDPENGIVFCTRHHRLATRGIITPDACLRIKKNLPPYINLKYLSLQDLSAAIRMVSEFTESKVSMDAEDQWQLASSILIAARSRKTSKLSFKVCAWALSVMAGFCISYMQGGHYQSGFHHPRILIDSYLRESNRYNRLCSDPFLSIHNLHHMAVNLNALLNFNSSSKLISRVDRDFQLLAGGKIDSLMPVISKSYRAYIVSHCISIFSKAGDIFCLKLIDEKIKKAQDAPANEIQESWKSYLEAALLIGDEERSDHYATLVGDNCPIEPTIADSSKFRVLAAWALRKGRNYYREAENYLTKSINIATEGGFNHQLEKSLGLKRTMEQKTELLKFSIDNKGASLLSEVL